MTQPWEPAAESGFTGDRARWERARRPIVEALDRDGTFLDVGCANGLLMESVALWAGQEGRAIEPYGLELSPALAARARERLPHWADRVFVGDVLDWEPPRRFDFVRTELVYVPGSRRRELVRRLLEGFVEPGGRLLVCSYGSLRRGMPTERLGELLSDWGFSPDRELLRDEPEGALIRLAWIGVPGAG